MPSDPKPRAYIASPLGFTDAGRHWYEAVYLPALQPHVEPVDPWSLTDPTEIEAAFAEHTHPELWREIGRRNLEAIRSCRLLIALLDGQELDSGTAAEVGYASALGLTCFGLRTDLRQTGEDGAIVNLQVQACIESTGGAIVGSVSVLTGRLQDIHL